MRYRLVNEPWILRGYIPEFIELAGRELWDKRISELRKFGFRSPYCERILSDYHWVELTLADELAVRNSEGSSHQSKPPDPVSSRALRFCQAIVETYRSVSEFGHKSLQGRIRDALQSPMGFSSLYQEMDMAGQLISRGYEVTMPDLDGTGNADLSFTKDFLRYELECKSLSADAGRKIHRRGFYEFMDAISPDLLFRARVSGAREIIAITLEDRLPTHSSERGKLLDAARQICRGDERTISGAGFNIARESYSKFFSDFPPMSEKQFYVQVKNIFGQSCHVAGNQTDFGRCILVMRSNKPDDHSKPQLEAMKAAAKQLSPLLPGFIALQYNDVSSTDLRLPHLRRRAGLLAGYLFFKTRADHVVGVHISAFGAISVAADKVEYPGILILNPNCRFYVADLPFSEELTDKDFEEILTDAPFPLSDGKQI